VATAADPFIYTTPLNRNSMTVFRSDRKEVSLNPAMSSAR